MRFKPHYSISLRCAVVLLLCAFLTTCRAVLNPGCECITFQSSGNSQSGEFHSPGYPSAYRSNIDCLLYTFIAPDSRPGMMVEILFTDLDLGEINQFGNCNNGDKLRVYQQQKTPDINEEVKADTQICGNLTMMSRRRFYSRDRVLIIELITDSYTKKTQRGFKGTYNFISVEEFETDGLRQAGPQCTYVIHAGATKQGKFFSPDFPQNYPPLSSCVWMFNGDQDERIQVTFLRINLAAQGITDYSFSSDSIIQAHNHPNRTCNSTDTNTDRIVVYDGDSNLSPVIGQYCGFIEHEQLVSTGMSMMVTFSSNQQLNTEGFSALYRFIKPVIDSTYTCDRTYISKYIRTGTITSELYPEYYKAGSSCIHKLYAAANERVALKFIDFDLGGGEFEDRSSSCDLRDKLVVSIKVGKTYVRALEIFCGSETPPAIMSNGPYLQLKFESLTESPQARGFKIQFEFVTDFGIEADEVVPYTPCAFWYRKSANVRGQITSPNYPGLYPKDTICQYFFDGEGSRVMVNFTNFDVYGSPPKCLEEMGSDYVSVSNYRDTEDKIMSRYCNINQAPVYINNPIISDKDFFMITFKSGRLGSGTGFKAQYRFLSAAEGLTSTQDNGKNSGGRLRGTLSLVLSLVLCSSLKLYVSSY